MRAQCTLVLLVVAALAAGACNAVLGLGLYNLACDAGNGGCGGDDTADAEPAGADAAGGASSGIDAAP